MKLPRTIHYRALAVVATMYLIGFFGSIALLAEYWTLGVAASETWRHVMGFGWTYGLLVGLAGTPLSFTRRDYATPVMLTLLWLYGVYALAPFCPPRSGVATIAGIDVFALATCGGGIMTIGLLLVVIAWTMLVRKPL